MFLIIGVSPKTKIIDQNPRRCPVCGSGQARLKRVDHYFNLFFVPVFKVRQGEPFLSCNRCEKTAGMFFERDSRNNDRPLHCSACGKPVEREFKFCPFCGQRR